MLASQPCATWREQRLGTHARELYGWRSVREGCTVQALRAGKKPAHSESLTHNGDTTWHVAAHTVARLNKHVHARSHSLTLSFSLSLSLTLLLSYSLTLLLSFSLSFSLSLSLSHVWSVVDVDGDGTHGDRDFVCGAGASQTFD